MGRGTRHPHCFPLFSNTVSSVPCPSLTLGPRRPRRGSEAGVSLTVGKLGKKCQGPCLLPATAVLLNCVQSSLKDFCVSLTVVGGASWSFLGSKSLKASGAASAGRAGWLSWGDPVVTALPRVGLFPGGHFLGSSRGSASLPSLLPQTLRTRQMSSPSTPSPGLDSQWLHYLRSPICTIKLSFPWGQTPRKGERWSCVQRQDVSFSRKVVVHSCPPAWTTVC